MRTLLLILCVWLWIGPGVFLVQAAEDPLPVGARLLDEGKINEAYEFLFQAFMIDPGSAEINFLLGRAAFEKGDYEAAIMAYERVLIAAGKHNRVRLELARSYMALNANAEARRYFEEVLAEDPPAAVKANIQVYLGIIEKAEQVHQVSGALTIGVSHDDNVGTAPTESSISVPALGDIAVNVDTRQSDWVHLSSMILNHVYKFGQSGNYAWKTTGMVYNAFNEAQKQLDVNYLGITSGAVRLDGMTRWEFYGSFNQINLGYDRYLKSTGLGVSLAGQKSGGLLASAGFSLESKRYATDHAKDSWYASLPLSVSYVQGANRYSLETGVEYENASMDSNSFWRYGTSLRYDRTLLIDLSVFAMFRWQSAGYQEADPSFLAKRKDQVRTYTAGGSRIFWANPAKNQILTGLLTYAYTDATSNIPLYDYDKHVVSVAMSFGF